ncbi:hypothetical protein [Streptococcus macacae]|uniref:Uncharacterized protein n=1 Tax=Streptococcus macacae NCTC 11558 TaxID=764298 RepID=G5JUQ1_9STRE|nr:hypothetical protein [Streptococcus macacae]EHJ52504.1 hypothetical protein STRMA_1041 [Streptococcus macacae NCTC 11558]
MAVEIVSVQQEIAASLEQTFDWFYRSENFIASLLVFKSSWRPGDQWQKGAKRDIIMITGWYAK